MAKATKSAAVEAVTLATIVAATHSPVGFTFASKDAVASFIADGLAEMNETVVNPDNPNEFAVRATPAGIAANSANVASVPAFTAPAPSASTNFAMIEVDAEEVPARRSPTSRATIFPFDDLGEPYTGADGKKKFRSFFVPATAERPKPWESLQSTVSAATRRYATVTGSKEFTKQDGTTGERNTYEYARKFKVQEYTLPDGTKGALVSRTL